MEKVRYDKDVTGLLVIDPYNDFISEGGKIWPRVSAVAEANHCVQHMADVLQAARKSGLRVFYALHRRYRPGDYETWTSIAPVQKAAWSSKTFEYGTWGGEIRREFEPQPRRHRCGRTLVFEWFRQHRSRRAAQTARYSENHRHRADSARVRGGHSSIC